MTNSIWKDKALLTVFVDVIVSLVTYFGGKYGGAAGPDIIFLIGLWQTVATALIAHYIAEANNAAKTAMAVFQAGLNNSPETVERAATAAFKKS